MHFLRYLYDNTENTRDYLSNMSPLTIAHHFLSATLIGLLIWVVHESYDTYIDQDSDFIYVIYSIPVFAFLSYVKFFLIDSQNVNYLRFTSVILSIVAILWFAHGFYIESEADHMWKLPILVPLVVAPICLYCIPCCQSNNSTAGYNLVNTKESSYKGIFLASRSRKSGSAASLV